MAQVMLSTIDNPYNPFTNFEEWYAFDELQAFKEGRATCCSYLARMSMESDDVSDEELEEIQEMVIDDIVKLNLTGKFIKVTEDGPKNISEHSLEINNVPAEVVEEVDKELEKKEKE